MENPAAPIKDPVIEVEDPPVMLLGGDRVPTAIGPVATMDVCWDEGALEIVKAWARKHEAITQAAQMEGSVEPCAESSKARRI